jgi:hypothetical protein
MWDYKLDPGNQLDSWDSTKILARRGIVWIFQFWVDPSIVFTLATMVKIEYGHLPVNAFNHGIPMLVCD